MTAETLKPCPYCGGESSHGTGKDHAFINCVDCLASHVIAADMQKWDRATAVEEWNKRAAHDEAIEAIGAATDRLDNLASALSLPMPSTTHVAALRGSLPEVISELRAALAMLGAQP